MEAPFIMVVLFSALALFVGGLGFFYFGRHILRLLRAPKVWVIPFAGFFLVYIGYISWLTFFLVGDEKFLMSAIAFLLAGLCLIGYGGGQIYLNLKKVTR